VLKQLTEAGADTELVDLAGHPIRGCTACYICFLKKNGKCVLAKDPVNDCIAKMVAADAILLGSLTCFADISSEMKAFVDRCGMVGRANGDLFRRKLDIVANDFAVGTDTRVDLAGISNRSAILESACLRSLPMTKH
jgi:multimeric flavodoxin WrbA